MDWAITTAPPAIPSGAVSVDWESYAFDKDRAIRLNIDKFDVDETAFVDTVANAVKVLREENTDPEIDAYRYAKVFSAGCRKLACRNPCPDGILRTRKVTSSPSCRTI